MPQPERLLIYAPRREQNEQCIFSWLRALTDQFAPVAFLRDFLTAPDTKGVILYGNSPSIGDIDLHGREARDLFRGKLLYDIGSQPADVLRCLVRSGAHGCLGYEDYFWFVMPEEEQSHFRNAILAGIGALSEGLNLRNTYQRVYDELSLARASVSAPEGDTHAPDTDYNRWLVLASLNHDQKSLFLEGNEEWCFATKPEIVIVTNDLDSPPPARVELVDITPAVVDWLRDDPRRLSALGPEKFEDLVEDRLRQMKFNVERIGSTFRRDGGIDLLAWSDDSPFPFLMAVQVKHSKVFAPIGPSPVREFQGVLCHQPVDIGVIVTNTRFTANAEWVAQQRPRIVRLRDIRHLAAWLNDNFLGEYGLAEIPDYLELGPDTKIVIPQRFGDHPDSTC